MCVVCFETNIPHHQLCFTDAGIVSARIHHVVVGPLHTEHASWMLAGSLVDLSGRIHVPHDDASIHRSRHKSSALRRPTDRRNGALMSQPLARHHRLVFSDLPHFDFTPGVAHGDEAIVRRDSQRVDSYSVVLQLMRSHGARKANAFFAQLVHFHILTSVFLRRKQCACFHCPTSGHESPDLPIQSEKHSRHNRSRTSFFRGCSSLSKAHTRSLPSISML